MIKLLLVEDDASLRYIVQGGLEDILEGKKLELEYPVSWQYKIIGKHAENMKKQALEDRKSVV